MGETPIHSESISIKKEMQQSYLDYAMSVIIGRALPDVRDGLKPVHRRILFAMHELKNDWNKPYKKSARVVGDVIGKYHPHGDSAVYDAIVRLAQDFSMRYMLVDGQGNFGSVDGDSPAAMRYTEVRMAKLSHQMLQDIDKNTVDFFNNYDESLQEPAVLPSRVPALLVNGSAGIAVGMATNIPPHNLGEVCDAITALIDDPGITVEGLMSFIPGPDFPTYGIIHGGQGIYDAYATGRGSIKIRGEVAVEKDKKGNDETIVITELPYQVNKARLIEKIADLVKNKVIEGIRYVRDESDKEGMRVAIGLKRQQFAEVIVNQLYKHTRLQHSFGINLLAVVNNRPEVLTLKEIFEYFILHRKEIIIRRTRFELKKAEDRAHILEGLKTAIDNLDEVVALIRRASSPAEAKAGLIQRFELTAVQAQAILDMRLQKLTGLERDKIITEYQEVLKQIAYYREILASEKMVLDLIKEELSELKENFGDERRTRIVGEASREINLEDMIVEEDMVVTVSRSGYIKRNPISLYKKQLRGGKGKTAMGTKEDDFVDRLFIASTHHTFLFFTNRGKVYWRKVYEIPQAGRASRGSALVNLLELEEGEMLATVLNVPDFEPGYYILMATRNGLVKKTDLMAYSRPRAGGIIALGLADDDELIAARITDGSWNVFLGAAGGKSVRFLETDVRPTGRISRGVRGMRLDSGDRLVGMEVLSHGKTLLTITENGYGKRTSIDEYPIKKRGGKGIITIKTSARNGMVVGILLVEDEDEAMIMTDAGKIIRISMKSISVISRNTQGVRLIGLDEDESVTGVARLAEEKETDDDQDDVMAADMTSGPDGADHD